MSRTTATWPVMYINRDLHEAEQAGIVWRALMGNVEG